MATSVTSISSGTPAIPTAPPQLTPTEQRLLSTITDPEQRAVMRLGARPLSAADKALLGHIRDPQQRALTQLQLTVQSAG